MSLSRCKICSLGTSAQKKRLLHVIISITISKAKTHSYYLLSPTVTMRIQSFSNIAVTCIPPPSYARS